MDDNGENLEDLQDSNGINSSGAAPTLGGKMHSAVKNGMDKMKERGKQTIQARKMLPMKIKLFLIASIAIVITFVLLCASAWYILDLNSKSTSTEQEYNSAAGQMWDGMDITEERWQLSREEIQQFINGYDTSNNELRQVLLERISLIEEWQNKYGYSPALLITIAFQELEDEYTGNNTDSITKLNKFFEKMDENGQKWYEKGYKTIKEIAADYAGEQLANEWTNDILNKMKKAAVSSGIISEGEDTLDTGDGYVGKYTSKAGKTFYNFKQYKGSYAQYMWVAGASNTIRNNGCALTSAATIISGYLGTPKNPKMIVQEQAPNGSYFESAPSPISYFSYYGISAVRPFDHHYTELSSSQKQVIIENLINGRPVMIYILGQEGITYNGTHYTGNSPFTSSQHWMALLDYNEANDTIYVSNPSDNGGTGWLDRQYVLRSCTEFILINN